MFILAAFTLFGIKAGPYDSMTLPELAAEIEKVRLLQSYCADSLRRTDGRADLSAISCDFMNSRQLRENLEQSGFLDKMERIDRDIAEIDGAYSDIASYSGLPPSRENTLELMRMARGLYYDSSIRDVFARMLRYRAFADSGILKRAAIEALALLHRPWEQMGIEQKVNGLRIIMLDAIAQMTNVFDCNNYFNVARFPETETNAIMFKISADNVNSEIASATFLGADCPEIYMYPGQNLVDGTRSGGDMISLQYNDTFVKEYADLQCRFSTGAEKCNGRYCWDLASRRITELVRLRDGAELHLSDHPVLSYCARKMLNVR